MLLNILLLVVYLAAIGFFTYIITTRVKMSAGIAEIIQAVVLLFCLLWVLAILFGSASWPTPPKF